MSSAKSHASITGRSSISTTRNCQEQLRADHITMMEMLQKSQDENKRLMAELSKLKKLKTPIERNDADEEAEYDEHTTTVDSQLIEQHAAQEQEIILLRKQLAAAEDQLKAKSEALSVAKQSAALREGMISKKKEMEIQDAMEERDREFLTQRNELHRQIEKCSRLQDETVALQKALQSKESELNASLEANAELNQSNAAFREDIKMLEAKLMEKAENDRAQIEVLIQRKSKDFECQLDYHMNENTLLREKLDVANESIISLQSAIDAAMKESRDVKERFSIVQEKLNRAEASARVDFCDSDTEAEPSSSFYITNPPIVKDENQSERDNSGANEQYASKDCDNRNADDDDNFKFRDYVHLKKENIELRKRVAELSQLLSNPIQAYNAPPSANVANSSGIVYVSKTSSSSSRPLLSNIDTSAGSGNLTKVNCVLAPAPNPSRQLSVQHSNSNVLVSRSTKGVTASHQSITRSVTPRSGRNTRSSIEVKQAADNASAAPFDSNSWKDKSDIPKKSSTRTRLPRQSF